MSVTIQLIVGVLTISLTIIGMGLTSFRHLDKRTEKRIAIDNQNTDKQVESVRLLIKDTNQNTDKQVESVKLLIENNKQYADKQIESVKLLIENANQNTDKQIESVKLLIKSNKQ